MRSFDRSKLELLPVRASAEEVEITEQSIRDAITFAFERASSRTTEQADTAAVTPIGANGHPRMLLLSAWIAHAGAPNKNGKGFTEADLQEAVDNGLWQAPFFGMVDAGHDFNAYGCFYGAEYKYNPQVGAYGILAHGAVFAWRYEELADRVMAAMARQGYVDVSMACMPAFYEPATASNGASYLLCRKPVFFTASLLLDEPPADPDARAVATEDPASTELQRTADLLTAALATTEEHTMSEHTKVQHVPSSTPVTPVEHETHVVPSVGAPKSPHKVAQETVTPQPTTPVKQGSPLPGGTTAAEASASVPVAVAPHAPPAPEPVAAAPVPEPVAAPVAVPAAPPVAPTAPPAAVPAAVPGVAAASESPVIEQVEHVAHKAVPVEAPHPVPVVPVVAVPSAPVTPVADAVPVAEPAVETAARLAAEGALLLAQAEIAGLTAEVTDLRAYKAARVAEQAEIAQAALKAERTAEIPEIVMSALEKREDKDAILTAWMTMDAATWTLTKEAFHVASAGKRTMAERSAVEGTLTGASDRSEGDYAIRRWIK